MTGQATVTIGSNSWSCSVASLPGELSAGLSNVASIPAGTGMLFDMGSDQSSISINTNEMLFNLDIVFISSGGQVVGVLSNVKPGDNPVFSASAARYFMEVNAGEASDVSVGDTVAIVYTSEGISWNDILGLVVVGGMMGVGYRAIFRSK